MTVTADNSTYTNRPGWDGPTDAYPVVASRPVPVPAPMPEPVRTVPTRYTPEGETKNDLDTGIMFIGVAVVFAIGSGLVAKMLDLHPLGNYYGYIWAAIGLVTCVGFNTEDTYETKAAAWRASTNKMVGAGISAVSTIVIWLLVWWMFS